MTARPGTRRLARAGALAVAFVAGAAFLTAVARHTRYGSSDNANALLAGQAMLRGNPLLRGWTMPHDSYWLLDLPLFGVASVVAGLRDVLLAAVPAVVDAAAIVAGSTVALLGRPPGRRGWVGAAVVAVLLGLPHPYLTIFVLQGPHHVATAVVCLVAFGLLAGAGPGSGRWVAGTGLLAVAAHSDPVAIAVGVVPVAAAGLLDGVRSRRLGAVAGPLAAAAGGLAGAFLLGLLLRLAGGYTVLPDPPAIGAWRENLPATPKILGGLLGVGGQGGLRGGSLVAHAIGAGLFAAGIAWSAFRSLAGLVRRRRSTSAWLDDVLLLGFAGGVALFALLTDPKLQAVNARYLLPPLVFGAVLTARRAIEVTARIPAPALAAAGLALGAAYLTTPLATVRAPAPANPAVAVADWLEARGLQRGYGQYWVAGLTTVSGRGGVAVRPVVAVDGRLRASDHFASPRWFGGDRPFRFVVVDPVHPDGVDDAAAVTTFGPPAEARDVGPYRVLVWDRALGVAPPP